MRNSAVFFLLLVVSLVTLSPLMAEDSVPPPLQLAPGSGIQQNGQNVQNVPPAMNLQEEQLRDIHGPLQLPEEPDYTFLVIGIVLLVVLLMAAVWYFRFRKEKVVLPAPDEIALAALMRARSLISSNKPLQYSTELSQILRRYIEARFRIKSTRQTTKEFFAGLTDNPQHESILPEDHNERLKECLEECDMAKFARYTPDDQGGWHDTVLQALSRSSPACSYLCKAGLSPDVFSAA